MTGLEVTIALLRSFSFILLYIFLGFGPGLVAGMLLANLIFGRGKPVLMERHEEDISLAGQHNAQWAPDHERWRE